MASYSVLFVDKNGSGITDKYLSGEIPANTSKLVFYNTGLEFRDNWDTLDSVSWDDIYQGAGISAILYNNSSVTNGQEVDYTDGNIEITVCYEYTPPTGGTEEDDTLMVVTFNYYIDGVLVDDTMFDQIEMDTGQPIDEIWPRTLECYHIRFDKINRVEDIDPGMSGNTDYNSLEFTYINKHNYGDSWPNTIVLTTSKVLQAFSYTYFSEKNCVIINGTGYEAGESFAQNQKPTFHSNSTKSLEVNLYYTTVIVSTKVYSYNVDNNTYADSDLWGYVDVKLNNRITSEDFVTTADSAEYAIPLTGGNSIYCKAIAKPGFEFYKWVFTSEVNKIHNEETGEDKQAKRRERVLALEAVETLDDSLPNTEIKISAYKSNELTAVFKGIKNKVKLYKGLDFSGTNTYYIYGGDKQWKNVINATVDIIIPTRKGATLLGWVDYNQEEYDPDTKEYLSITKSQYDALISLHNTHEEVFNELCSTNDRIISGVIRIDDKDGTKVPILLSNNNGYTDSQGNWLTGDKVLYPLWVLDEYDITYKSDGKETLIVDETAIDPDGGSIYNFDPNIYGLPTKYTIANNITFEPLKEINGVSFPRYYKFDKWEPAEIKQFTKTGDQTITAYWMLDTYKITLEKNNNYPNQTVKIKIGESAFVGDEEINVPTTRTAYKSFEGWYTKNNLLTNNGNDLTGKLIINKDGNLQSNVSGYTDSSGNWIRHSDTSVYAKWTPEEYTITYHIDYKEKDVSNFKNYTIEDTIIKITNSGQVSTIEELPRGLPLLTTSEIQLTPLLGHSFDGWYTNKNYTGSKQEYLEKGSHGDKTFYARYVYSEYTIVYNNIDEDNCSNYEDLPNKHTYGSATSLVNPEVSQYKYKFIGWYTDEQFTNQITSISANYTGNSTIYLYAKLAKDPMSITYKDTDGNVLDEDPTIFNDEPPTEHTYDTSTTLVGLHKTGYTFDGWYDNIECSGESFMELGANDYLDDIVLYYKFIPIEKTINYYIDGVKTTDTENPSTFTVEDLPIILENPENKTGYHSIGWRRNSASSTTAVNQITYIDDWELYWVWEPNVVTITWDANGGSVTSTSSQYTYDGESITLLPTPTRAGYDFAGWYTAKTGGTKITDVGVNNKPAEDITYYAQWTAKTVTITWDFNDGTGNKTLSQYTYGGQSIQLNIPTRTGYEFNGWYTSSTGGTKINDVGVNNKPTENVTYYAQWTVKTVTITWNANGGSVTPSSNQYTYNGNTVQLPTPTRTGYDFAGWYTSTSGGTKITEIGVNNKPTEDITYYALWNNGSGVKYTVKHCKQALDGTYSTNHLCVTEEYYGTTGDSVTPNVKEYTGFTSPSKQTVIIAAAGTALVVYNYERNKYNITWDVNGGEALTGNYTNGSVYYETPIIKPTNPTKEGYVFSGWSPTVPDTTPANDIAFTASYEYSVLVINPVAVDFNLEIVEDSKITTNMWLHNIIGEPEKNSWENLNGFFTSDFCSNISGECITGNDLQYFIEEQPNKGIMQADMITIFSQDNNIIQEGSMHSKSYVFTNISTGEISTGTSYIDFTVVTNADEENIPNYPETDGFIIYFTVGNNTQIYKAIIPVNKPCRLIFNTLTSSDPIIIQRIPLYYSGNEYKCIFPKMVLNNRCELIHDNTLLIDQCIIN